MKADKSKKISEQKQTRQRLVLLSGFVLLILIKGFLVWRLPIQPRGYQTDDALMVRMASGLLSRHWLGQYSAVVLMKGMFYPLFLAVNRILGLPLLMTTDLIHSAACLFFVLQIRDLIPSKTGRLLLFAVLVFDPVSSCLTNFQRVYRSSIVETQSLFLFGCYYGIYLQNRARLNGGEPFRARECLLPVFSGLVIWSCWNTREETMWMLPFLAVGSLLILLDQFRGMKDRKCRKKDGAIRCMLVLVPLLTLMAGNLILTAVNGAVYGVPVRLEIDDGAFADALKTIYSVKNEEEIPCVSVSREKLERLMAVSPSLDSIREELETELQRYAQSDRNRKDLEVEDGWFFWALRYAAFNSGKADTLPRSQEFWTAVREEIENALNDPESGLERIPVMPSALLSPWRGGYESRIIPLFGEAYMYMIRYVGAEPEIRRSQTNSTEVARTFEILTGNLSVMPDGKGGSEEKLARIVAPFCLILTGIVRIYRLINPVIFAAGIAACVCMFFLSIKGRALLPHLAVTLGMLLTAAVTAAGVAYTDLSAFPAIREFYLAAAYPLMLGGEWIAVLSVFPLLRSRRTAETIDRGIVPRDKGTV